MELIFAPFLIVFLFWKQIESDGILISIVFFLYAIGLFFFVDLPTNSRIGSLFIGLPSISYLAFIFPSLIPHEEKVVKTTSCITLLITSLLLIYFQLFVY
jgi:hypothetical protein